MENNTKKRISLNIAGVSLNIVTDESEEFVNKIADTLNDRINRMRRSSFQISVLDAALLCAIENVSDRLTAEKHIRSLEAQLSLCEMNIRNLRDENNALREEAKKAAADNAARLAAAKSGKNDSGDQLTLDVNEGNRRDEGILDALGVSGSSPEEKVSALEKYLENKRTADNPGGSSRTEKIKYIESLLRGGISTDD
ncbi:MAG: cell division protein ZapA [Clostridia bacterium]|nr:cell division protein ZapA [Clostridia bacterium]